MDPAPPGHSSSFEVVAIGSSAGGVVALTRVVKDLPATFPAPILVVQHLDPRHETVIAEILAKRTSLHVQLAAEGETTSPGTVYIAPPNRHLLVGANRTLMLSDAEMVHFVRPSVDLLFESVAAAYAERVVGVILTGSGTDGAMGVEAVKERGGTVIVQDPESAEFSGMPQAALATGAVDFVLGLEEIPSALHALVTSGGVA
ncbi:MAG TPA: chemotaxis protein CheB [Acidimicrobiales bacterium]|nr:chemotaxis protein CheB [Acidimicrobiales bacterium]